MNENKQKALIAFKKASTSLARITKMLESDAYCMDIMQQNLAVIGLLKSAHQTLLKNHLQSCFTAGMKSSNKTVQDKMVGELLKVVKISQ